jgi:transposase-like protein
MAPQEYDFEMRQQAHDLYVIGGLTFAQVAQATGVSESQLKRWSAEEREWAARRNEADPKDWPDLRKEFRSSQSSAARQAVVLRALLISNALSSKGEFKSVLSAATWEKTQQQGSGARGQGPVVAEPSPPTAPAGDLPVIKTPQDAVCALEELVNRKLNLLATQPGLLNFQAVKDVKQTLALIDELKGKYRPDEQTGQAPGLSDEAADEIRRQFLGIK